MSSVEHEGSQDVINEYVYRITHPKTLTLDHLALYSAVSRFTSILVLLRFSALRRGRMIINQSSPPSPSMLGLLCSELDLAGMVGMVWYGDEARNIQTVCAVCAECTIADTNIDFFLPFLSFLSFPSFRSFPPFLPLPPPPPQV